MISYDFLWFPMTFGKLGESFWHSESADPRLFSVHCFDYCGPQDAQMHNKMTYWHAPMRTKWRQGPTNFWQTRAPSLSKVCRLLGPCCVLWGMWIKLNQFVVSRGTLDPKVLQVNQNRASILGADTCCFGVNSWSLEVRSYSWGGARLAKPMIWACSSAAYLHPKHSHVLLGAMG